MSTTTSRATKPMKPKRHGTIRMANRCNFLIFAIYSLLLFLSITSITVASETRETASETKTSSESEASSETATATEENCENPDKVRIILEDELKRKNGKDENEIWLSVLGEVYDVTAGKQFYGEGSSYSGLAARDGSVGFSTGVFTEEEAKKVPSEALTVQQLAGIDQWRTFYKKEKKYRFVGYLKGLYYDEEGNPTEELKSVNERLATHYKIQKEAKKLKMMKKKK